MWVTNTAMNINVKTTQKQTTKYHGCCMLTNQIAQLEVGNSSPEVVIFCLRPCSFIVYSFRAMVTSLGVGFYQIDTTSGSVV